jgi:hypothetical protein
MIERDLANLPPGLFGLMQPLGGAADIVFGQCHARSGDPAKRDAKIYLTC